LQSGGLEPDTYERECSGDNNPETQDHTRVPGVFAELLPAYTHTDDPSLTKRKLMILSVWKRDGITTSKKILNPGWHNVTIANRFDLNNFTSFINMVILSAHDNYQL